MYCLRCSSLKAGTLDGLGSPILLGVLVISLLLNLAAASQLAGTQILASRVDAGAKLGRLGQTLAHKLADLWGEQREAQQDGNMKKELEKPNLTTIADLSDISDIKMLLQDQKFFTYDEIEKFYSYDELPRKL